MKYIVSYQQAANHFIDIEFIADIPQHQEYPAEYVGFRCVATWKKHEKK